MTQTRFALLAKIAPRIGACVALALLAGACGGVSMPVGSADLAAPLDLTGSIDGAVRTYDLRKGALYRDALGPPVGSVRLSHDGNCVLASTLDATLRLLDKASGQVLCEYRGHANERFKLEARLSRDDSRVLGGSEDGRLHAWDLVRGASLGTLQCHSGPLVSLELHPTSHAILTASHDGTAKMWVPAAPTS